MKGFEAMKKTYEGLKDQGIADEKETFNLLKGVSYSMVQLNEKVDDFE